MSLLKTQSLLTVIVLMWLTILPKSVMANEKLRQTLERSDDNEPFIVREEAILNIDLLQSFYQDSQFSFLWRTEQGSPNAMARELVDTIASIDDEGLLPNDYHYALLLELNALTEIERELVLSDAFVTLVSHLIAGKTDAQQIKSEWKSLPKPRDASFQLLQLAATKSLTKVLADVRPVDARYEKMKQALISLRKMTKVEWLPLTASPVIKTIGASDPRISDIATRLKLLNDLAPEWDNKVYDDELFAAVKRFQRRHGLKEDGVLGKESFTALNITPADRVMALTVNLERFRWLDEKLGNKYVLVNIAGFYLRVIENNELMLDMPVIVGREFRKTPVFSDKIRYLVLNPQWVVPTTLAVEDKLPAIKADQNYLKNFGFSVYQGNSTAAVDPSDIDWKSLTKRNFNLRLVQAAGPLNALGQIKFMFPNEYDVYLHDTPARELFEQTQRNFSSGCIRVSAPLLLAENLLAGTQWDLDRIKLQLMTNETKTVHLKQAVPVHIEYWTAWADINGVMNFRADIYKRDALLYAAMQQSLAQVTDEQSQLKRVNEQRYNPAHLDQ
ncbi:L,D-transpeptidase family protein [Paraglaciecola sp.]|uniref:L,D-transpeptidase family protein n=1 Tax=Paraglaciecola sp. TaxID=1920173 RepID=UPI0030F48965